MNNKVGVAISTHKRPRVLAQALRNWALHMPDILVVNHDRDGAGVAATKNAGITALMDAGCEHLFLADDDMWPVTDKWAKPYVADKEPHLMHCWGRSRLIATVNDHYTVWTWPRGVLLYVERRVIEKVGGMRTEFDGAGEGEHVEWSGRIHNAGLTANPFADLVVARNGIWHCEDYNRRIKSSLPETRYSDPTIKAQRHALYEKYRGTTDFVDYR